MFPLAEKLISVIGDVINLARLTVLWKPALEEKDLPSSQFHFHNSILALSQLTTNHSPVVCIGQTSHQLINPLILVNGFWVEGVLPVTPTLRIPTMECNRTT